MGLFVLPKVDSGIAKTGVGCVVFARGSKMAASLDIVSFRFAYKESVLEESKILAYGGRVGVELCDGVHRVADFAGIGQAADSAHDNVKQPFDCFGALDVVAFDDVFEVDRPIEVIKIDLALGV